MRRKKTDFKPLTEKGIVEKNPNRKNLSGKSSTFKKLVVEGTKHKPFDKS